MPKLRKINSHNTRFLNLDKGEYYERLATNNIRAAVRSHTPFIAGKSSTTDGSPTVFGRWEWGTEGIGEVRKLGEAYPAQKLRYVVYSYGFHFPMFIWDEITQQWYGNSDKYSRTTSRHQYAANPTFYTEDTPNRAITWLNTGRMISIARYGVFATVCHAAGGSVFDLDE